MVSKPRRRPASPTGSGLAARKGQQMNFVSHRQGADGDPRPGCQTTKHGRSFDGAGPVVLILGLATAAAVAVPASASASTGASPVIGHVYVNDNTAGTNTIAAFNRHADGTLTPEAGSPFPAGGAGTGAGLASQGASRSRRTGGSWSPSTRAATRSPCCGSTSTARSAWSASPTPAAPCPTASPSTATWSTWPTPATVTPTTPASGSASTASCSRSTPRPSRWPPTPRPVMCCSTAPAPSWPAPR